MTTTPINTPNTPPKQLYPAFRDLSPQAQGCANWFRQLARSLRTGRLYKADNLIVVQARENVFDQLTKELDAHGAWQLRVTPIELYLLEEPVIHPSSDRGELESLPGKEEQIPFFFYRDGIRGLTFLPGLPIHDFDGLYNALLTAGGTALQSHDDLVTLLWQANPLKLQVEALPMMQTIYLSSRQAAPGEKTGHQGQAYAWSPSGQEIRADIGQLAGASQGLHRDTFDDWPLPESAAEVPEAYQRMLRGMEFIRTKLLNEWAVERAIEWTDYAPELLRRVLAVDPAPDTRQALAHSLVTWLATAVQKSSWDEAQEAFKVLRELDPDGRLSTEELTAAMGTLDTEEITERLDESEIDDQSKFFALAVGMGKPSLDLACSIMARATKSRTRAAACTMLCFLCGDGPELLAPYLTDSRWYVVRNAVFILGQIGGSGVVSMLRAAAFHPEPRVRRQVVQSLGNVPRGEGLPILVAQLDTRDPQLLAAALHMLTRHQDQVVARAILKHIEAPDFETRSEDNQRSLFNALVEVADESAVPALETLLYKGGWFARRTFQRTAAARALQKLGTEAALAALEAGLRSRSEAVRNACLDAMSRRGS